LYAHVNVLEEFAVVIDQDVVEGADAMSLTGS
jgi:hypothetical protein